MCRVRTELQYYLVSFLVPVFSSSKITGGKIALYQAKVNKSE